ncbi:unnamed protein product [Dracunculus medinensis]|uniref:Pyridoxine-5'-phosphate oxidase n=1 Tax=Dracunculus medinensis TaxID=318479 RepID=A0A0N4UL89_DRAME|nr:unnamed protein product [Dracunculus medinensis]
MSALTRQGSGDNASSFGLKIEAKFFFVDWRRIYLNKEEPYLLEENLVSKDPFDVFDIWFKNVASKSDISFEEINAVCFSTSSNNRPSSRMVLMKDYGRNGFSFYTNYDSRKGKEIAANPFGCLLFYWPKVDRQIRVEGRIEKLPNELADDYWKKRPVKNRIGSKLSEQSKVIPSRNFLLEKKAKLEKLVEEEGETAVSRPENWFAFKAFGTVFLMDLGGYRLVPDYFEFWQGQSDRIHDRIVFEKSNFNGSNWKIYRLSP